MRCTYCYVPQGDADMDEATGRIAVEAVFGAASEHGFGAVKLKYAGGEPTLNFPLVRSLHARAFALSKRYGLELREVLLSNGLDVPDAIILALRDMGIRLAISLDGIGETHDAQRGWGTFTRVAQSVDRATDLGLNPHISVTVTEHNVDDLANVVSYVLDRGLSFNLNFYRETACVTSSSGPKPNNNRLTESLRGALQVVADRLPRQSISGGLLDRVNLGYPHNRPCGVGQSYVVVDHRGHIARCHMEMDAFLGTVGKDDLFQAIRATPNGWRNLQVDAKHLCNECTWRYWCAGGCPLLTHRLTGHDDYPSPYCEVYRALFPEILRLEGLRLLKWGPPMA
jgi:uncharacterized protein